MTPKHYKENKSSLRQFLEKKELVTCPKEARGKNPHLPAKTKYFYMLERIASNACEEDKARLEAVGWTGIPTTRAGDKDMLERFESFKFTDGTVDPSSLWYGFLIFANGRTNKREKGYYVAGKRYESREEFLLSRTKLGKELL